MVKDAAGQALESMKLTDPHMPKPYLPAIQDGTQDQKLAAIDYLKQFGDASIAPLLRDIYSINKGELKNAAYRALWQLSLCGYSV